MARQAIPFQGTKKELPGARVMLTRNIEVQSGLCIGIFSQILKIATSESDGAPYISKLDLELVSENVTMTVM